MRINTFRIVAELETFDAEIDRDEYKDWRDSKELKDIIDLPPGQFSMTETEMRWVILDAVERQLAEDAQFGMVDGFVEDHNIISALSDNGFCPAFVDRIYGLCGTAMKQISSN